MGSYAILNHLSPDFRAFIFPSREGDEKDFAFSGKSFSVLLKTTLSLFLSGVLLA